MLNIIFLVLYLSTVYSFTELYDIEGFSDCVRLNDYFDKDTAWYNCTGRIVGYSDFDNVTDDEYYATPVYADYNKTTGKFSTFDEFSDEGRDNTLAKSANMNWAQSIGKYVSLSPVVSFIEWSSAAVRKGVKNLMGTCSTYTEYIRDNGNGYILHINVGETGSYANDNKCDTLAQLEAITGAIGKWVKNHKHLCGQWCMNLTHNGNLQGYITLGVGPLAINPSQCENIGNYGEC